MPTAPSPATAPPADPNQPALSHIRESWASRFLSVLPEIVDTEIAKAKQVEKLKG